MADLIPRSVLFGNPERISPQISPDGSALAWIAPRDGVLWSIYVRTSEYGSGLADQLLEAVLPERAPAELWVFEANDRARRFYSRHGFKPDGARHVFGLSSGVRPRSGWCAENGASPDEEPAVRPRTRTPH